MGSISIIQTYDAPSSGPAGLAWDGRRLWNSDFASGRIFEVDPASGAVERSLVCPGNISGLTWDGRALWQSLHDGELLQRINPETNDFDQTLPLPERGWLSGLAWDGRLLWAISQQKGELLGIDTDKGQVTRTLPSPVAGGDLDYHDGYLWLSLAYPMVFDPFYEQFDWQSEERLFALVQIDPRDGREVARHTAEHLYTGVAWVNGELWLSHAVGRCLYRAHLNS